MEPPSWSVRFSRLRQLFWLFFLLTIAYMIWVRSYLSPLGSDDIVQFEIAKTARHAEAIILGCAGLQHLVEPLSLTLGVPVIEGVAAAVKLVEALLAMRLATSKRGAWGYQPQAGGGRPGGLR